MLRDQPTKKWAGDRLFFKRPGRAQARHNYGRSFRPRMNPKYTRMVWDRQHEWWVGFNKEGAGNVWVSPDRTTWYRAVDGLKLTHGFQSWDLDRRHYLQSWITSRCLVNHRPHRKTATLAELNYRYRWPVKLGIPRRHKKATREDRQRMIKEGLESERFRTS